MNFKSAIKAGIDKLVPPKDGKSPEFNKDKFSVGHLFKKIESLSNNQKLFYTVSAEDWYKTYPYRFVLKSKYGNTYYSLPVPPEALSYQMVVASQLTPTLGGVVEETSQNVFWQISLTGTTGIAISRKYTENQDDLDAPVSQEANFRKVLKGGLLANTFNKVANLADPVMSAIDNPQAGIYGLLEGLASTGQRFTQSAVPINMPKDMGGLSTAANFLNIDLSRFGSGAPTTNGYVEIHLLHNFLNAYSKIKDMEPDTTSLYFESQKDNMQWQVSLKNFLFQKNASQPYLYKYNIVLQGFDLKESGDFGARRVIDRFGPNGDLGNVSSFTLSGAVERSQSLVRKLRTNPLGLIASKPPII